MAETVVSLLIEQLAPLIKEKVALLSGVRKEVAKIKETLESIRSLLKDADRRQQNDEGVKVWVKQVREVSYDIENVLDEFFLRIEQPHGAGFTGILRRCPRFCRNLVARHRIASEIQSIKLRLANISDQRSQFSFTWTAEEVANSRLHDPRLTAPLFLEESEVVGIDTTREELINLLLSGDPKPVVISVIGMGGLGKTTLVRKVFQNEKVRKIFNSFAWVTVSKSFSPVDLLKSMLLDFKKTSEGSLSEDINSMNYVQLVDEARCFLQDKRYVVVLDDVWTIDVWENYLKVVFPENELKSRIMVTTRINDVASQISKTRGLQYVYKLKPLPPKEAWTLFCQKTFHDICPPELVQPSEKMLEMCRGLPLAIVAIGGLLRTKNMTPTEWDLVQQNLSSEHNNVLAHTNRILGLSYDDLPYHLKPCFLYLGIFPQDYPIARGQLIREWIAEGFVQPMSGMPLEQIAEHYYLNELVNRNLLEVVTFNSYGRVARCRVHDIIHEFILSKCREQNFITLGSDDTNFQDRVHRLSIYQGDTYPEGLRLSEVRSLFIFGRINIPDHSRLEKIQNLPWSDPLPPGIINRMKLPTFPRFQKLKVLNLSEVHLDEFPCEIGNLFHLRYLNLRRSNIDEIPDVIRNLRNLQTLDLKYAAVTKLPAGILDCGHLRLILRESGVTMPAKLGSLTSLHKLVILKLDGGKEQARELGKLTQLRTLGLYTVRGQDWVTLRASISGMRHLETLRIYTEGSISESSLDSFRKYGNDEEDEPLDMNFLSELPPSLKTIRLRGLLQINLSEMTGSFVNLVKIGLAFSRLQDDPLEAFGHLPNLADLRLQDAYDGEEMCCGPRSYQRLKLLSIRDSWSLKHVRVGKGAMPELEYLFVTRCQILQQLPFGIENLTTLKELNFDDMPTDFIQKISAEGGEEREKVKHIPIIRNIAFSDSGGWYIENLS